MEMIRIQGGNALRGRIPVSGAKNAALPLMATALLSDQPLILSNVPHLADISSMAMLLSQHGVDIALQGDGIKGGAAGSVMRFHTKELTSTTAPYDLVRKMRASVLVLGPLVARAGVARVSLPGGCAIGNRPVDLHLMALEELGAEIEITGGYVEARAPKGLTGGRVIFPKVSVGATENILMAASLAKGETEILNAAREPEIIDLCHCLMTMGVEIEGAGSDTIRVQGRSNMLAVEHSVIPDRIETGTYAMAAAITGGEVELIGARESHLVAAVELLRHAGVEIEDTEGGMRVSRTNGLAGADAMTEPFPGFPTDLQAQFMSLMAVSDGAAMITETIFENRFMHVPELARMGANVTVHGSSALVRGVKRLRGAPVMATDLRASVSLVLAGLAAEGETEVRRIYHLDRGYERLEEKLAACGAVIERVRE
jgi:UDP-N-acetylglucosamine 1-carboxyvinyltransferase